MNFDSVPNGSLFVALPVKHEHSPTVETRGAAITDKQLAAELLQAVRAKKVVDLSVTNAMDLPVWWAGEGIGNYAFPYHSVDPTQYYTGPFGPYWVNPRFPRWTRSAPEKLLLRRPLVHRNPCLVACPMLGRLFDPGSPADPGCSGATGRSRRKLLPSAPAAHGSLPSGHRNGRPSQAVDPAQDRGEQRTRHRHLGQLEDHVAAVAHDPGTDLDQPLSRKVVSDQCATSPGSARLRRKLARL
jgi:hypothetical protein